MGVLGGVPVDDKEQFEAAFPAGLAGEEGCLASKEEAMMTVEDAAEFPVTMPDDIQFPSDHMAIGCVIRMPGGAGE